MNMLAIKVGLRTLVSRTGFFLKRNAPKICTTLGVAGFVGTAVATGTAAVKTKDILDERDKKIEALENDGEDQKAIKQVKKETAIQVAKTFAPPVMLGAASTALIFGGQHMMGRRAAAALASAYEAQTKLHKYRGNVVRQLGEEVDRRLSEGEAIDKADISEKLKAQAAEEKKNLEDGVEVINKPYSIFDDERTWWFGESTCSARFLGGVWTGHRQTDLATLRRIKRRLNDRVLARGYLLMNDGLLDEFGAQTGTTYGATHGWCVDPKTGEIPKVEIYVVGKDGSLTEIDHIQDCLPDDMSLLFFNADEERIDTKIDEIAAKKYYKHYTIKTIGDRKRFVPVI